jgi:hypothetical protein
VNESIKYDNFLARPFLINSGGQKNKLRQLQYIKNYKFDASSAECSSVLPLTFLGPFHVRNFKVYITYDREVT